MSENPVIVNLLVPSGLKEIQITLPKEDSWPAVGPKMVELKVGWTKDYSVQAGGPATVTVLKAGPKHPDPKSKSKRIQLQFDGNVAKTAIKPVVVCS